MTYIGGGASALLALLLAGCGGGGGGGSVAPPVNEAPPRVALSNLSVMDGQPTTGGFTVGELYADDPEGDSVTLSISGGTDAASFALAGNALELDDGTLSAAAKDHYEVTVTATDSRGASVSTDLTVLVIQSLPLTIGYYDLLQNMGRAEQATPITAIGETPVDVGDINTADLSAYDVLFVQNPVSSAPTGPYIAQVNLDKVADFVANGGVLVFHDRYATTAESYLPGMPGDIGQDIGTTRTEFELVQLNTFVEQGPGGTIDNTNLESANSLSFGFADASTVPRGSIGYLSRNDLDHWISYAYPFGQGYVVYSTIPLDFYLLAGNPEIMRSTYAPNILAEGRALRRKGVDIDDDGLLDVEEVLVGSNPTSSDSDGDGLPDAFEVHSGLNPAQAGDQNDDSDGDGLDNAAELAAGTEVRLEDTDADGLSDGDETSIYGTDPLARDTDADDLTDYEELMTVGTDPTAADSDGGGTNDGRELLVDGTNPLDAADDLNQVSLPTTLNDGNGYIWDVQGDGNINNGTSDAYDGGYRLLVDAQNFPVFTQASLTNGDRELRLGVAQMSGLSVHRRIFVPSNQAFARFLEVFENPTAADISIQVQINTNLGSDGNSVIVSTTNGNTTLDASDTWVVSDDTSNGGGDPSLAHVAAGTGASVLPAITAPLGSMIYTYDLTVPANGRAILMHFASQNANRTAAIASAGFLAGLGNGALQGLSTEDMQDIVNFDLMQPVVLGRPALQVSGSL